MLDLSNLKAKGMAARQKKAGVPEGLFQSKLVSCELNRNPTSGILQAEIKWMVIDAIGLADMSMGPSLLSKQFTMKYSLEGENAIVGLSGFSEAMVEICTPLNIDMDQYKNEAAIAALFLQFNSFTIVHWIKRKMNKKGTYLNCYFSKAPASIPAGTNALSMVTGVTLAAAQPAPVAAPAPTAGENWNTPAPSPAPVAAPAPAPAQPAAPAPAPVAAPAPVVKKLWASMPDGVKLLPESEIPAGTQVMSEDQTSGWYVHAPAVAEVASLAPVAAPAPTPSPAPAVEQAAAPVAGKTRKKGLFAD